MKNKDNNKSFGILFFIVFLLVAIWPVLESGSIRVWSLVISIIFLILGIINSKILTPLKSGWIKFGEILGKVIAPIVMMIVYFIVLTPLSFIVKLFIKDLLNLKFVKNNSYWIIRKKDIGSMKKQF